jgi:hypothetical protein
MKVYAASEAEIDHRLMLDKRKAPAAFCKNFQSESEVPIGFYDLQDKIRDGLEGEFFAKFGDGKDRSRLEPWRLSGSHNCFFFPAELISSERIIIELNSEILNDKLIGVLLSSLERMPSAYCAIVAVFSGERMKGSNYRGRFVINREEIAVEESLVETWSKQVQFMEIENRN